MPPRRQDRPCPALKDTKALAQASSPQELWAMPCVYQVLRHLTADTASRADLPVTHRVRVSLSERMLNGYAAMSSCSW